MYFSVSDNSTEERTEIIQITEIIKVTQVVSEYEIPARAYPVLNDTPTLTPSLTPTPYVVHDAGRGWQQQFTQTAPSPRKYMGGAYDIQRDLIVAMGGTD